MNSFDLSGIPEVNGAYEVGLATGVDASLSDSDKICVPHMAANAHVAAVGAAAWAFNKFTGADRCDYVAAAYAVVKYGLVSPDSGDSRLGTTASSVALASGDAFQSFISEATIKRALLMVVATKVNWWTMNHHTGSGSIQGFARKTAFAVLGATDATLLDLSRCMYVVGHWCSTRRVLSAIGIPGVKVDRLYIKDQVSTFLVSEDVKVRLRSMPAGTHKHAIVYAIAKRMAGNIMAEYSPVLSECEPILDMYHVISMDAANYHIGSLYLTGYKDQSFSDAAADVVLGRCATFIMSFYPNSTIAASPHISKAAASSRSRISKASDYEDFDDSYQAICNAVRMKSVDIDVSAMIADVTTRIGASGKLSTNRLQDIRDKLGMMNTPVVSRQAASDGSSSSDNDGELRKAASFATIASGMKKQAQADHMSRMFTIMTPDCTANEAEFYVANQAAVLNVYNRLYGHGPMKDDVTSAASRLLYSIRELMAQAAPNTAATQ